jgi:predicted DNA-binding mobile mystery protein A
MPYVMKDAIHHLDQRFKVLRPLARNPRPSKGWIRAIRDALGMTSVQLAQRLGVSQPRIIELEKSEASGTVTLNTLQRAAEALGCRLVYALVPDKFLEETVLERANQLAQQKLTAVQQTMRLEDQSVRSKKANDDLRRQFVEVLLKHPARLWDEK